MNKVLSIRDYPITIDPVSNVIELRAQRVSDIGTAMDDGNWMQFHRILRESAMAASPDMPEGTSHIVGDDTAVSRCTVLLCYAHTGALTHAATRSETSTWKFTEIPEELTGKVSSKPSLRLVFQDDLALQSFVRYLDQVQRGKVANPTIAMLLERLHGPYRICDVSVEEE